MRKVGNRPRACATLCLAVLGLLAAGGCTWEQVLSFVQPVAAFPTSLDSEALPYSPDTVALEPAVVPFGVGEYLEFSVSYNILRAGTATMSVEGIEDIDGHDCYRIASTARSNSFVSTFFEVRDNVTSLMDVKGLFSRRFERHLREGKYIKDEVVYLDHCAGLAYYDDGDTVEVRPSSQDALSSLYFVRTLNLEVGKMVAFPNHTGKKNYPLRVRVLGREKLKTPAGWFSCLVVEPRLKSAGVFKHEGKLTVWLTDDERKMPVQMKTQIMIGAITATLVRYRPGSSSASEPATGTVIQGSERSPGEVVGPTGVTR